MNKLCSAMNAPLNALQYIPFKGLYSTIISQQAVSLTSSQMQIIYHSRVLGLMTGNREKQRFPRGYERANTKTMKAVSSSPQDPKCICWLLFSSLSFACMSAWVPGSSSVCWPDTPTTRVCVPEDTGTGPRVLVIYLKTSWYMFATDTDGETVQFPSTDVE